MDQPHHNPIIQTRQQLITPLPPNSKPSLKLAHFINPSSPSSTTTTNPPPFKQTQNNDVDHFHYQHLPVKFNGWRNPSVHYKNWVVSMSAKYKPVWKKVGIYDAIINSTYEIKKMDDLVTGFVKNWCPNTKSFVFEWGECSVTLEDIFVLGGFSILGDSVLTSVKSDSDKVMDLLMDARREIAKGLSKKAAQQKWMNFFMNVGHQYEHEGFLAYWLSMFVFPHAHDSVGSHVIPIAVNLASGRKIALAPAVLASIYRDMRRIVRKNEDLGDGDMKSVTVWAPFQLVQVWIWERFVSLRPKYYSLRPVEPRMARWAVQEKSETVGSVDLSHLDWNSFDNEFQWRPYASNVNNNVLFSKLYENRTVRDLCKDELQLQSFARCLRPCELVGFDCIEQYLPHRVSMQFGFDQDIPSDVRRSNKSPHVAWKSYSKHIDLSDVFIPSLDASPGATAAYIEWRKQIINPVTSKKRKDKFERKVDSAKISSFSKKQKKLKHEREEDIKDGSHQSHLKIQIKTPRNNDSDSVPSPPPGFEHLRTKRRKIGESSVTSNVKRIAERRFRKLNDFGDDNLSQTEEFSSGKRLENNGLLNDSSEEDHVPLCERMLSRKKRQCLTVIPNNKTSSVMPDTDLQNSASLHAGSNSSPSGEKENSVVELDLSSDTDEVPFSEILKEKKKCSGVGPLDIILEIQFESASLLPKATDAQKIKTAKPEGENDIYISVENHVLTGLTDLSKNAEGLNGGISGSEETEVAVNICHEKNDNEVLEKKEKPWTRVERLIEIMARELNLIKAAARARGHIVP